MIVLILIQKHLDKRGSAHLRPLQLCTAMMTASASLAFFNTLLANGLAPCDRRMVPFFAGSLALALSVTACP